MSQGMPYTHVKGRMRTKLEKKPEKIRKFKREPNSDGRRFSFMGYAGHKISDLPEKIRLIAENLKVGEIVEVESVSRYRKTSNLKRII